MFDKELVLASLENIHTAIETIIERVSVVSQPDDFLKTPGSKDSSTSGISPRGHLERQSEFHASTQEEA